MLKGKNSAANNLNLKEKENCLLPSDTIILVQFNVS